MARIRADSVGDHPFMGGRTRSDSLGCLTTIGALPPAEFVDEVAEWDFGDVKMPSLARTERTRRLSVTLAEHVTNMMSMSEGQFITMEAYSRFASYSPPPSGCTTPAYSDDEYVEDRSLSVMAATPKTTSRVGPVVMGPPAKKVQIISMKDVSHGRKHNISTSDAESTSSEMEERSFKSRSSAEEVWFWGAPTPAGTPVPSSPANMSTGEETYGDAALTELFPRPPQNDQNGAPPHALVAMKKAYLHTHRHRRHNGVGGENVLVSTGGNEEEDVDIVGDADTRPAVTATGTLEAARVAKKRKHDGTDDTATKRHCSVEGGAADIGDKVEGGAEAQRRFQHNVMERQRRGELNNAFSSLRKKCASIAHDEKVAKVVILRNALDIIAQLKARNLELDKRREQILRGRNM